MTTNASHLPKARLNQIAQRKLAALGLQTRLSADESTLEGELRPPSLTDPLTNLRIDRIRFVAENHDHMRFTFPLVWARLPTVHFYELTSLEPLWVVLDGHSKNLAAAYRRQFDRLKQLGIAAELDQARACFYMRFNLEEVGVVTLEGDENSVYAVHFSSSTPKPSLSLPRVPAELPATARDRSDLELWLCGLVEDPPPGSEPAPREFRPPPVVEPVIWVDMPSVNSSPPRAPPAGAAVIAVPQRAVTQPGIPAVRVMAERTRTAAMAAVPMQQAVKQTHGQTLAMLAARFGEDTFPIDGAVFMRDVVVAGKRLRFTATHQQGRTFVGQVTSEAGNSLWQDSFEIDSFPGVDKLMEAMTQTQEAPSTSQTRLPPVTAPRSSTQPVPAVMSPRAPTQPVPAMAPRAVTQSVPAVTAQAAGGAQASFGLMPQPGETWLMRVVVQSESPSEVRYVTLDSEGTPSGVSRVLPIADFAATFQPQGSMHTLIVRIVGRDEQSIAYVQVNQGSGQPRAAPVGAFMTHFVPHDGAF